MVPGKAKSRARAALTGKLGYPGIQQASGARHTAGTQYIWLMASPGVAVFLALKAVSQPDVQSWTLPCLVSAYTLFPGTVVKTSPQEPLPQP